MSMETGVFRNVYILLTLTTMQGKVKNIQKYYVCCINHLVTHWYSFLDGILNAFQILNTSAFVEMH